MPLGKGLDDYPQVWLCDFEFTPRPGDPPLPVCMVAQEFRTGQTVRLWEDELRGRREPPFPTGPESLFVAFVASAELGCFLALGWPLPCRILDLYVEFRNRTNGTKPPHGAGLLGAMAWHGLNALEGAEKKTLQELACRGGPWSPAEREALLDYCQSDVEALRRLLPAMLPELDLPRATLRGRYMAAVARMEAAGIPVDVETLTRLRRSWGPIQERLIRELDGEFGVYEGRSFRAERFERLLAHHAIPWPRTSTGRLRLDDETFKAMGRSHRAIAPIRKIRDELAQLRLSGLEVGFDGRSRVLFWPFGTKTGRNTPSNSQYVFGMASWLRSLVRPGPGRAIAYLDWSQQEFGIGAVLSRDSAMIQAYESGDPYLMFGKQAGLIPPSGTKQTHKAERDRCKACVLGVQYGMGAASLAHRIGKPPAYARQLLQLHRETYPRFRAWSDGAETHAMLFGRLQTVFGWSLRISGEANPRSLRNFPCQANGAELLRLACCLATERGLQIIAPVHDALAVEAEAGSLKETVAETQECMARASEAVLGGFRLRSDVEIIRHPKRFQDERGVEFWGRVMAILEAVEAAPVGSP
jgi:hypothetical protein